MKNNFTALVVMTTLAAAGNAFAYEISSLPAGSHSGSAIWGDASDVIGAGIAVGQTFTVESATANKIDAFSFWAGASISASHPGTPTLTAYLFEWSDVVTKNATYGQFAGNALFISAPVQLGGAAWTGDINKQKLTFNTGGVTLQSGKKYVAFLTGVSNQNGSLDLTALANNDSNTPDPISGGNEVYALWNYKKENSFATLAQAKWTYVDRDFDLAFEAKFSAPVATPPVPEPETYAMLLAGLGVVGWSLRKRKQLVH